MSWIYNVWNESVDFTYGQAILFSLSFLFLDTFFFVLFFIVQKTSIIEYGYPKRSRKFINKKTKKYSKIDRFFCLSLIGNADKNGAYLLLKFLCILINYIGYISSLVGIVATMITSGTGWSCCMTIFSPIMAITLICVLSLVPDMLCRKSAWRRYKYWRRYK